MKQRFSAHLSGEIYTHRLIWHTAQFHHELGRATDAGAYHHCLSAALMAAFAFEAFLNYLGPRISQNAWQNERQFFTRGNYRGTLGKLRFLAEQLEVKQVLAERPQSTVRQLFHDRNLIAHARPEVVDLVVHAESLAELPKHKEPDIFLLGDLIYCSTVIQDVEALADSLAAAAVSKFGDNIIFGPRAFQGPIWAQGGAFPSE